LIIQRKRVAKRLASGLLAGALAFGGLAISGGGVSAKTPSTTATRVQGSDRYATSVALAGKYTTDNAAWSTNANIILASGENFPDALAASSLAKLVNAPIILTKPNSLPASVRDWLLTKQSSFTTPVQGKVYVVGGTSAVSDEVVTEVLATINTSTDTTPHTSVRLGGADRYETAAKINAVTGIVGNGDRAIIVNGNNFADAVSAGPLAYKAGWPVIPINGSVLDANALGTLTALATADLGAGNSKVLILGGSAAVSTAVEEQLAGLGVNIRNIKRVQGADRYATSLNLNAAIWDNSNYGGGGIDSKSFDGSKVALVSGENFPDALSAAPWLGHNSIHLQLTNSSGINPSAAGLLSTLARHSGSTVDPATLYAIGGTSAVSAETLAGGVAAAQATNISITSMDCIQADGDADVTGARVRADDDAVIYLNFANGAAVYDKTSNGLGTTEMDKIEAGFTKDGATLTVEQGVSVVDRDSDGKSDAFKVTVSSLAGLLTGSTIAFGGVTEVLGGAGRAIGSASCSIAQDVVAPIVSLFAPVTTSGTATTVWLKGNENLDCGRIDVSKLHFGATAGATNYVTVSAQALSGALCKVVLDAGQFSGIGASTTVAVLANAIPDRNGVTSSAVYSSTMDVDNTPATVTAASVACSGTANGAGTVLNATNDGITVTAISKSLGGSKWGVAGNSYKISVVTKRGMLIPTFVVDDSAKTITITADTSYHNAADVKQAVANLGGNADWSISAGSSGGTLKANAVAVLTTGGTQDCAFEIITNELVTALSVSSLVVNGLSVSNPSAQVTNAGGTGYVTFTASPTTVVSSGSIAIGMLITDQAGNSGVVATAL